eukprot:03637.XXX_174447_173964_1 [CDS] Oithona nana genome sequencing.
MRGGAGENPPRKGTSTFISTFSFIGLRRYWRLSRRLPNASQKLHTSCDTV